MGEVSHVLSHLQIYNNGWASPSAIYMTYKYTIMGLLAHLLYITYKYTIMGVLAHLLYITYKYTIMGALAPPLYITYKYAIMGVLAHLLYIYHLQIHNNGCASPSAILHTNIL